MFAKPRLSIALSPSTLLLFTGAGAGPTFSSAVIISAGARISGVTICDPDALDNASNSSEVKDCIDDAKDCNAALACMLKAKP